MFAELKHKNYNQMKELYKTDFSLIEFDEEKNYMALKRFDHEDMNEAIYKSEAVKLADFIEEYSPKSILMDNSEFNFVITPEVQEWVNQNVFPRLLKAGLERGAFLISPDLFAQVAVEQTLEETIGQQFTVKYFEQKEEAITWLLQA